MLCYNIIAKLNGAQLKHPKIDPPVSDPYGRVGFYARLTGLPLSIEPLADVIGIDACYDGENKVKYNTQSSHLLSVMSD